MTVSLGLFKGLLADLHMAGLCVGNTRKYIYFTYSATDIAFNVL